MEIDIREKDLDDNLPGVPGRLLFLLADDEFGLGLRLGFEFGW